MPQGSSRDVDAWLARVPQPQRAALERLRRQIRAAAPRATEGIGYGLPGFYLEGPLVYFGAGKDHLALYGRVPDGFDEALAGFKRSKGAIRFTPERPLPAALVRRLVRARVAANRARAPAKRAAKAPKRTTAKPSRPSRPRSRASAPAAPRRPRRRAARRG